MVKHGLKESQIITLPLAEVWYNMIRTGEKREEYREIKPYWTKRLKLPSGRYRPFKAVRIRYGYTRKAMLFRLLGISTGVGRREWGAPRKRVYILHLGKRITKNINTKRR